MQCAPLELVEQGTPREGLATKRTLIDQADLLSNGDVQLAEREEPTLAQRSQNPVLCYLDAGFHGPLVLGPIGPGWQSSERVPACQLLVAGVQTGLIPARFGDARLQIVRLLWPTGLCGRAHLGGRSRSWNSWLDAKTGHITQPS